MSWEEMRRDKSPCKCGKGYETFVVEMDDWNRVQNYTIIDCVSCEEEKAIADKLIEEAKEKIENLEGEAEEIAKLKYFASWSNQFEALNKKKIWEKLTQAPSLTTFYKHVKWHGMDEYIKSYFCENYVNILSENNINDDEINVVLSEIKSIKEKHKFR